MHLKKVTFLAIAFVFSYSKTVCGQTYSIDSLKNIIVYSSNDTTKLYTINTLLSQLVPQSKESFYYNDQIGKIVHKQLFKKSNSIYLNDFYLSYAGVFLTNKGNQFAYSESKKAIKFYNAAIKIFNYLGEYDELNQVTNAKAICLVAIKDYKQAINCYFKALKYFEINKNYDGANYTLGNIAKLYHDIGNYNNAIFYYKKTLQHYDTIRHLNMNEENQKSIILLNLGTSFFLQNNFDTALVYFNKAIILSKKINNQQTLSIALTKTGMLSQKQKKTDLAIANYNDALSLATDNLTKSNALIKIGELYLDIKKYDKAIVSLNKGLEMTESIRNFELKEFATLTLYKTFKATNQIDKALKMLELFLQTKDSTQLNDIKNELINQQLKYDYEKRELETKFEQEKKVSALKLENEKKNARKNVFLYILISLTIILMLSAFYIYEFFKQKNIINANKNNELKQKLLLSQMNPHFIFNSVDNIQSLIQNNRNKEAINYLTKFSKLTRQILENSTLDYISLQEEITMLDNYLNIQQLLHNNKFNYSITLDRVSDTETLLIPPMLVQPFIENAIKHGLKNKTNNGIIELRFYMDNKQLFFEVVDNGDGIEFKNTNSTHKSMSTRIVSERLNNKLHKKNIEIKIETIYEGKNIVGAKTIFEIPYIYDN